MACTEPDDADRPSVEGSPAYAAPLNDKDAKLPVRAFHVIEQAFLILVALMTLGGAASELYSIFLARSISLSDILMMFLYTEVIGMVAVFYSSGRSAFIYPIFIAITALSRLIVLQSKDMAPENIVFEASAILLLTLASLVFDRVHRR